MYGTRKSLNGKPFILIRSEKKQEVHGPQRSPEDQ